MIEHKLKPYTEYKGSSVSWLGKIPTHWVEKRAKTFFKEVDERSTTGKEELLSVSHLTGVTPRSQKNVNMFLAESNVGYKLCRPGDIAINTMWAWMGALGVVKQVGLTSPSYGVYRPNQLVRSFLPDFLDYLLRIRPYVSEYYCRSTGITTSRLRLYPEQFLQIPLICPPLVEQSYIVNYLKYIGHLIRCYISTKKKLSKLLNEQKQAIINKAVTRGLDPNVRLKPSGVEWLGDVPEGWEIVPLKWCICIGSGEFLGKKPLVSDRNSSFNYPVIGGNGIMGYTSFTNVESRTIAVGRVGALCGNIHFLRESAWVTDNALHISKAKGFNLEYLALQMRVMNLNSLSKANAQPLITGGMVKKQKVIRPDIKEQQYIVQQVYNEIFQVDNVINDINKQIHLIKEYHTRLITDVVTGKLDVREAAESLPEELNELEFLEQEALDEEQNPDEMDETEQDLETITTED